VLCKWLQCGVLRNHPVDQILRVARPSTIREALSEELRGLRIVSTKAARQELKNEWIDVHAL
jgi:hypothetical protein